MTLLANRKPLLSCLILRGLHNIVKLLTSTAEKSAQLVTMHIITHQLGGACCFGLSEGSNVQSRTLPDTY